jgi:ribonuclease-3
VAQSNKIFKNWQGYRIVCIGKLEKQINYKFKNIALLEEAITHSSFQKNKLKIDKKNYERLEFLGDRVLGLVLSEYLLKIFPEAREGVLDNYFQKFANQDNLFNYAKKINLSKFLKTQKGDNLENNKSILSDVVESIIGAIYIDTGLKNCKSFITNNLIDKDFIYSKPEKHPKSILQEYCLHQYNTLPKYSILNKSGNEHQPIYEVSVYVKNHDVVSATGANLKKAEEAAATKLLNIIKI